MKHLLAILIVILLLVGFATPAGCLIGYVNRQTIVLYDQVSDGDEVEIRTLFDGQEKSYHITINSPGGAAFVGMSIVNHIRDLKESGAHITTEVSSLAMSAAAIVWLMGDVRIVHKYDILMFHGARMIGSDGNEVPETMLEDNDKFVINNINESMREELAKYVGNKKAKEAIDGEWFLTGKQAFEMGLATTLK